MRGASIFLLVCLPVLTVGQVNIDSLKDNLSNNKDITEVKTLLQISENIINSKLLESSLYAKKALGISNEINYEKGQIQALNIIGNYHQRQGRYDSAIVYYHKSLMISEKLNDTRGLATVYNNIGIVYTNQGEYDKALEYYQIGTNYEQENNNLIGVAEGYNNIGVVHYYLGNVDLTLEYLEKAVEIQKKVGDLAVLKKSYNNLGAIYDGFKQNKEMALEYYTMAFDIGKQLDDKKEMSISLLNIGGVHFSHNDLDKATEYYNKSLALRELNDDKEGMAYVYLRIAEVFETKNKLKESEAYCFKALEIANLLQSKLLKREAFLKLTNLYQKLGNLKAALNYMEQLIVIKDSLLNDEKVAKVTEMEAKYLSAEKDKQLLIEKQLTDSLEQETIAIENKRLLQKREDQIKISKRNNLIIGLSGGVLIIFLGFMFIVQRNKRRAQQEKDKALLKERDEGTKAVIEAQEEERKRISKDLHDGIGQQLSGLKMAWQNVSTKVGKQSPELFSDLMELTKVLDDSADEVRSISHQMMPRALQEFGLVPALEDMLEKAFKLTPIIYEFNHHKIERFETNREIALYRICQELVNNISKHSQAKLVHVQLHKTSSHIVLMVEDNGIGIKKESADGHGMLNIKTRLNLINGEVHFNSHNHQGTTATIRVPIN